MPDIENFLAEIPNDESSNDSDSKANTNTYNADLSYIYYKGKSLNINIYHKQTELEKRQLECDPDTDYNFLRIEVQVKKSKLNTLVSKVGLKGRELQYLVTPEIERYVLEYYVSKLTGKGIYVTYDRAMNIIDNSGYTKSKKARLKKVIEAVVKKHGIAKVLEQVENGNITDLGTPQTVKRYLKEIEKLGINPVTISARMNVPKQTIKNQSGGKDISEKILFNLVDILSAYGDQMEDYQNHGVPITDEVLEQIDKLYQSQNIMKQIKTVTLDRNKKPTEEQIKQIEEATKREIVFDEDSPELTPAMEKAFRLAAKNRNTQEVRL